MRYWSPTVRTADGTLPLRGLDSSRGCPRRPIRRGHLECSLDPRCRQRPPIRADALDFHLLAADLIAHSLDVIAADLLQPDFLDHPRGLADQGLFGGLADLDR